MVAQGSDCTHCGRVVGPKTAEMVKCVLPVLCHSEGIQLVSFITKEVTEKLQ